MAMSFWCSQCKVSHAGDCPPAYKLEAAPDPMDTMMDYMTEEELKAFYLKVKAKVMKRLRPWP